MRDPPPSDFNPRSPHGERPNPSASLTISKYISIHAPRMGSDLLILRCLYLAPLFQSTLPAWGATLLILVIVICILDFNPRSPHGERPASRFHPSIDKIISIHAPRMGSDRRCCYNIIPFDNFNPRSPHGERPMGKARCTKSHDFNPRSPHGERLTRLLQKEQHQIISIHAPRMGSDI